jgi:hypothetical protein
MTQTSGALRREIANVCFSSSRPGAGTPSVSAIALIAAPRRLF